MLAQYDAIADQMLAPDARTDDSGHGTHVTSLIAQQPADAPGGTTTASRRTPTWSRSRPLTPTAAAATWTSSAAIDWVVANKDAYNIRVLNLSFSAAPQSYYWDDPLNQAVMRAWQAGIVVVAAAGNTGPDPMTIGVPGNVPYIITVGAMSDNYTPDDHGAMTSGLLLRRPAPPSRALSSPTWWPPAGTSLGLMPADGADRPGPSRVLYRLGDYFTHVGHLAGHGRDQRHRRPDAAGQPQPDARRRQVPADGRRPRRPWMTTANLAYSIFQQGAGMVNAYDAVYSTASGCANQGLNIAADLAGIEHYGGHANQDPNTGDYYLHGI